IYVKRKDKNLSVAGATFVTILKDYFDKRRKALT
ncbi:TPA: LysR family transcriptional regulator, partial [Streptococcus pyogenes]